MRSPLLNWWLTSTPPTPRCPPTPSARWPSPRVEAASAAVSRAAHGDDRRDRDVAVDRAGLVEAVRRGSSVRSASRRDSPAAATVRAIGGASPSENSASSQPARADDLEGHRRVLAAANRHQHALDRRLRARRRGARLGGAGGTGRGLRARRRGARVGRAGAT